MLAAHIDASSQLAYDENVDFVVSLDSEGFRVLRPLNDDARNAFLTLQHAINRVALFVGAPTIPEDGLIGRRTFLAARVISSSTKVVTTARSSILGLDPNMTFAKFLGLDTFRSDIIDPANLKIFTNIVIFEMGNHARLWAAKFAGIADAIWSSSTSNLTAPIVPDQLTTTSKVGIVIGVALGWAIGVATTVFFVRRRLRS